MKNLFILSLLLLSALSFGQIKINPVLVGYPAKTATDLMVRVMPFETDAVTCQLYYQLKRIIPAIGENTEKVEVLADGNLSLTILEFDAWGRDNSYIENLALQKLLLTRKD